MTPILTALFSQGLSLLGNAVLAKGQDVIEDKLGISLDSAPPEVLRQAQFEHEEFLLNAAIKQAEIELADVQGARNLGIELSKSTSFLNQNIMPLLALITVIGSASILLTSSQGDTRMAAASFITMVLGYFFGSSKGSKDKQELLSKLS